MPPPVLRAAVVCAAILVPASARSDSWQADLSASYQRGKYGSEETTTILSVPLTIKRLFDRGEASVTVSYLTIETPGGVVVADGSPQTVSDDGGDRESASGLGDVVVKGKYSVAEEQGLRPYIDLVGRLKLPTAAADLGTGELDIGLGAELSHRLGRKFFAMADAMHTFVGDPPGTDYRNRDSWDLGLGWQPRPGSTVSVYYDYKSSLRSSEVAARSLLVYGSRRLRRDLRLYCLLEIGLSTTAADLGLTAGIKTGFRL